MLGSWLRSTRAKKLRRGILDWRGREGDVKKRKRSSASITTWATFFLGRVENIGPYARQYPIVLGSRNPPTAVTRGSQTQSRQVARARNRIGEQAHSSQNQGPGSRLDSTLVSQLLLPAGKTSRDRDKLSRPTAVSAKRGARRGSIPQIRRTSELTTICILPMAVQHFVPTGV